MEIISSMFAVFLIAMITNNIILTTGYGICSYIGVSKNRSSAIGMGVALVFVTFMSALVSYFLQKILVALDIEFMQTVCFILVIASLVQLVEMICKKFLPSLYNSLGIYLPLITTNCVVLFVTKQICDVPSLVSGMGLSQEIVDLISSSNAYDLVFALIYALGIGFGYFIVIFVFSTIREKIDNAPVIKGFKGAGIALVTTAIMALAITGLAGVI